jgi:hypothetical protein
MFPPYKLEPLAPYSYAQIYLLQCDEVQNSENTPLGFPSENPHYLAGLTCTADTFQNN